MTKIIALCVMVLLASPGLSLAADGGDAATKVKGSKSNTSERASGGSVDAASTVKSGKSNSSDRAKGGSADAASTVKSSKSNSSE